MRNRSKIEIAASILEVAQEGVTKITIMYHSFLSTDQLRHYLALLTDQGLLQYDRESNRYTTTERGRDFIAAFKEMSRLMNDDSGED